MKDNETKIKKDSFRIVKKTFTLLIFILIAIIALFINKDTTFKLQQFLGINKEKQLSQNIDYKIYSYTNGTGKMLITFTDEENGIASLNLNNEREIKVNKNMVAIDYDFVYNGNYTFKIITKNGKELIEDIAIDDEFIENNSIKMENTKPETYNYKLIKLKTSLLENVNYKKQYKVENGQWTSCENSFMVFDNDVKDMADENQEVRIYVRAINVNDESQIVEVSKKFKVDINATSSNIQEESILAAVKNEDFIAGKFNLEVNGVTYGIHSYYEQEGDQVWDTDMIFGTDDDIGTANTYAQNMVIVKVNGNLTINEDVYVGPYHTEYGGPKGFMLYVTGTLTNNGIIDNSHGGYAIGQNVYLWKNANGEYEYVPAVNNETTRKTGNGGAGTRYGGGGTPGAGGTGTSYSGGAGGGGVRDYGNGTTGSSIGGPRRCF